LGRLAAELGAELKALTADLERLKALSQAVVQGPRRAHQESVESRVSRMLKRLGQGGDVPQHVVRELFPDGIWLYPDPDGGRFLWAYAQTPAPADLAVIVDADGNPLYSLPEAFPRIYNVIAGQARNDVRVDGSGSGGTLQLFPQEEGAA
jgi:hypothetical protein